MLGEKMRTRRRELGLTQKELAKGVCSPSLLSMVEAGRSKLSHRTLVRLAERLKVSTRDLLEGEIANETVARFRIGVALLDKGEWQAAAELFLTISEEDRLEISAYEWLYAQARCGWLGGQHEAALSQLEEAFERAVVLRDERQMLGSVLQMGELEESRGQAEFAYYHYRRAERIRQRSRRIDPQEESRLYRSLHRVAGLVGRAEEALQWLERAKTCERLVDSTSASGDWAALGGL
ncbi:MAG: helix-turn-helix domain-containing protein [Tumebacillaceae bacterium]